MNAISLVEWRCSLVLVYYNTAYARTTENAEKQKQRTNNNNNKLSQAGKYVRSATDTL